MSGRSLRCWLVAPLLFLLPGCTPVPQSLVHVEESVALPPLAPAMSTTSAAAGETVVAAAPQPAAPLPETDAQQRLAKVAPGFQPGPALPDVKPQPGGVRVMIPERMFKREGREKALRVSYDDLDLLKVLNMEPVTTECVDLFPPWLKQLHGQTVRIRGFMYPTFEATGLTEFVLARDNQICCFVALPRIYDVIAISLKEGTQCNYIPPTRSFDVLGRMRIDLQEDRGVLLGLYWIDDAVVIDR